jgi:hypothetical protein
VLLRRRGQTVEQERHERVRFVPLVGAPEIHTGARTNQ